jgi:hemerythrin-like domain-containing protein
MSTASLRRDHDLIERVLKSMWATIPLLKSGKTIPDVCHHGKEENSLFPELEKKGMPRNAGPIAVMLMEHEMTRKLAKRWRNHQKLTSQQVIHHN